MLGMFGLSPRGWGLNIRRSTSIVVVQRALLCVYAKYYWICVLIKCAPHKAGTILFIRWLRVAIICVAGSAFNGCLRYGLHISMRAIIPFVSFSVHIICVYSLLFIARHSIQIRLGRSQAYWICQTYAIEHRQYARAVFMVIPGARCGCHYKTEQEGLTEYKWFDACTFHVTRFMELILPFIKLFVLYVLRTYLYFCVATYQLRALWWQPTPWAAPESPLCNNQGWCCCDVADGLLLIRKP